MGLGTQIRKYRLKAGWTLERLSEASGVEIGTINALENRDSSRSKFLPALARALGLTIEQLADEKADHDLITSSKDGVAILELREPAGHPYMWPFKEIKPRQWDLLNDQEQKHIEDSVLMLIKAREDPKHQAPEKNVGSAQSA